MILLFIAAASSTQPPFCVMPPYGIRDNQQKPFICSRAFEPSTDPKATAAQKAGGPSLNWPMRNPTFFINKNGTKDITGTQEYAVIRQAFVTWTQVSGAQFTFTDGLGTTPPQDTTDSQEVGFDFRNLISNQNIVIFQSTWDHSTDVIGLTTATFNAQTGEIFDADIELNDEHYNFTIGDTDVETDLLNTVTHEVGHFVGFDHTDKPSSTIDSDCASTATMASKSGPGEIAKRILAPSDEMGMRFVYPAGGPNGFCNPPTEDPSPKPVITQVGSSLNDGCAQHHGGWAWLAALALVLRQRLLRQRR